MLILPQIVFKIDENKDVFEKVAELMEKENTAEMVFVKAEGKIRAPEIVSHGKQGSVFSQKLKGDYEVNAISGSLKRKKGQTISQVNIAITHTGTNAKIGHLVKAKAGKDFVLTLRKIDLSKMIM